MKQKFNSLLLVLAAMLSSTSLFAHDFEVDGIFYNITSDEDKTVEVTFKGNKYNSYDDEYIGAITIPESVTYEGKTYRVTSIPHSAFRDCPSLTSITVGGNITTIGYNAFYRCTGLTSINIPGSVISIENQAFYNCTALTSINIPSSVEFIGDEAFYNTPWYTNKPEGMLYAGNVLYEYKGTIPDKASITIKEGTVSISPNAFKGGNLTSITIPNSVKSIGEKAFYYCTNLTSVNIPNSVTSIGDFAFSNCHKLTSATIGSGVKTIGEGAFASCDRLASITIPNSVTNVGRFAFNSTPWFANKPNGTIYVGKALYMYKGTMPENTSIEVNAGTVSISPWAFSSCSNLTSITLPNSVTSIGDDAFYRCTGLSSITFSNNLTSIGDNAFDSCSGLTSVSFPNSVTSIGYEAFWRCTNLTSVTIPNSVTSIDSRAFYECPNLAEVISYIPADKLFPAYCFGKNSDNCVLTVPLGAMQTYKTTDGWKDFKNIVEMQDLNLIEGTPFENATPYDANTVTYSRTLPNLKWNALYLPVEIPVSALSENYDVAYFNNMHAYDDNNDGTIDRMNMEVIRITGGTLHANHPYFIRAKNDAAKKMNLNLTDVTVQSTDEANCTSITTSSAYMNFELTGIYTRHEASELEGCYAITGSGSWAPIAAGSYLNPYRFYLKITQRDGTPVKQEALQTIHIYLQGEDELTGIETNAINGQTPTEIYDLQGRRVAHPTKGVYIVNGKKVMF